MTAPIPGIPPPEPEFAIRLTPCDAETVVNGLRGWVHHQAAEDLQTAATTPELDGDPWPDDKSAVADKIDLAMQEAIER